MLKILTAIFLLFECEIFGQTSSSGCGEPPPVPNAIRHWQGGAENSNVTYTCYPHHVLVSGDLVRWCIFGVYSGQEPKCVYDCGPPREINGLVASTYSSLVGSTVHYDCENGYVNLNTHSPADVHCEEETKQWSHTWFCCYDISSTNYAQGKPTLHNGIITSAIVDGTDTTCSTQTPDFHLIEIDLGTVANVISFKVTMGTELPFLNVSVMNSNNNILSTCKIFTSTISPWTTTSINCNPTYSTRAPGDKLYITTQLASPITMKFCEMEVTATNYIGDCGQPPVQPGQQVSYSTTDENSIATISCVSPWHAKSGSKLIVCHLTQWSESNLVCTLEHNIAQNAVAVNLDGELALDNNTSTCYLSTYGGGNNPNLKIDLQDHYEIYSISVTFKASMVVSVYIKVLNDNGGTRYCQPDYPQEGVTLFNCTQGPVGRYINMTAIWPLNICDVKVHGRLHKDTLECSMDQKGRDYKGYQTVTVFGKTCLPWSINSSFSDSLFPDLVDGVMANYCRNPQTFLKERPWCFISQTEWELCPVYECSSYCKTSATGFIYNGGMSIAASNKTCKPWKQSRFRHDLYGNVKRCQNTYNDQTQPWCITDTVPNIYEFCPIPDCPTVIPSTITRMENSTDLSYENELQTCMHWSLNQLVTKWNPLTLHIAFRSTLLNTFCPWSDKPIIRMLCIRFNLQFLFLDFICDPKAVAIQNSESSLSEESSESPAGFTSDEVSWMSSASSEDLTLAQSASSADTPSLSIASPTDLPSSATHLGSLSFALPEDTGSLYGTSSEDQKSPSIVSLLVSASVFETYTDNLLIRSENFQSGWTSDMQSNTLMDIQPTTTIKLASNTDSMTYTGSVSSIHQPNTHIVLEPSSDSLTSTTHQSDTFQSIDLALHSKSSPLVTLTSDLATRTPTNVANPRCPCLCSSDLFWSEDESVIYKLRLLEFLLLDKRNLSSAYRKKKSVNDDRPLAIATGGVGVTVIFCVLLYLASGDIRVLYNIVTKMFKT